ncbi:TnsA endonuclease N-terminal domain-containing protein [Vibrio europaeus]|uniref:TnsA endonuclease N-terminal domain-containing protein n=1 Tax=Vibrio europaeus TaxID=300876 RepID=UPI00233F5BEE|nr:TnsA endonuclease N-terminal domain-containing protein [Vibrio europaeus]MDC5821894.1 TnsA endonuclease N-terminal domain-containing protein [Vibrio europaeus]
MNLTMSVRKIPKNYRNLTGLAASNKAEKPFFESTLERDFLTLLEFDQTVLSYDVQPITVGWEDDAGKERSYTPDVLAQYRVGGCSFTSKNTVLYEVKYRSDIKENWLELKPKFQAAIRYAKSMGWRFKLMTEVEIRTVYMENARFLLPYFKSEINEEHMEMLIHQLIKMRQCSIEALLTSLFNDRWAQAELVPTLWGLIASRRINTDLNIPLTMSADVWIGR